MLSVVYLFHFLLIIGSVATMIHISILGGGVTEEQQEIWMLNFSYHSLLHQQTKNKNLSIFNYL